MVVSASYLIVADMDADSPPSSHMPIYKEHQHTPRGRSINQNAQQEHSSPTPYHQAHGNQNSHHQGPPPAQPLHPTLNLEVGPGRITRNVIGGRTGLMKRTGKWSLTMDEEAEEVVRDSVTGRKMKVETKEGEYAELRQEWDSPRMEGKKEKKQDRMEEVDELNDDEPHPQEGNGEMAEAVEEEIFDPTAPVRLSCFLLASTLITDRS